MPSPLILYSAVDDVLTRYDVDVIGARLHPKDTLVLPARLQYAWPHPARPVLYCSTSDGGPRRASDVNPLLALGVAANGAPCPHGNTVNLPQRAVHVCVDPKGRWVVNAHNFGGGSLTVHRLDTDGSLGERIAQPDGIDYGVYPHQVRVFPSGNTVLIVDRGNSAHGEKSEDPGALRTLRIDQGVLSPGQVVAPGGGYGFGPRHVDFHPTQPWIYVSDERTNRLYMFRYDENDQIEDQPAYTLETLADTANRRPRQIAGPIHVHPAGSVVYVANRADHTIEHDGQQVFGGGENNIAVFDLDPETGRPALVQHADTHSYHVRTFSCDPEGKLLITASIKGLNALDDDGATRFVSAGLSIFRIDDHGHLSFVRKVDVATSDSQMQYWMGLVQQG